MKTLDEVIYTAPYVGTEWTNDALYYLKEYQGYLIGKEISETFDEAFTEMYNPPLTWDELKTMEGKPVWVEFLNDEGNWNGEWCLVESSDNLMCEILRCQKNWWGLRKITLGKTWQAYQREKR